MGEKSADDELVGASACLRPQATARVAPRRLVPVFVPVDGRRKQVAEQRPALWLLCIRWMEYHSIQVRWDVERFLARCLKRRWGGL